MNYLLTLFLIGVAILLHEAGHFYAGKLAGIEMEIFSIGFGPKLIEFEHHGTKYRLSMIPLGGYVLPKITDEEEFFHLTPWRRILMAAGGPLASLILPWLVFILLNILKTGLTFEGVFLQPLVQVGRVLQTMFGALMQLFQHSAQLSGIVGIVSDGGRFIGFDLFNGLSFLALISMNFMVMNLIPLPVLDGGKILLYLLELIHPKAKRLHYPLALAGWVVILGLTVYVTVLDLGRLF